MGIELIPVDYVLVNDGLHFPMKTGNLKLNFGTCMYYTRATKYTQRKVKYKSLIIKGLNRALLRPCFYLLVLLYW